MLSAQEQKDSLVRLLDAKSAKLVTIDGQSLRKVIGPATFLHNDTYLYCDSALWNVEDNFIDALGNVKIVQTETTLSAEKIHYLADKNLAQFRGTLVELVDKDSNYLRTNNLDYNTKDSIATFFKGGALRDKDGNIIESKTGQYESILKKFEFYEDVDMFSDSILIKSNKIVYYSDTDKAVFGENTKIWKEDNYIMANAGWYDRANEIFFFNDNAYVLTLEQEIWGDSLTHYRKRNYTDLRENVQVTDSVQSAILLADRAEYNQTPTEILLTKKPSVLHYSVDENLIRDTLFVSADTIKYYIKPIYQVDSMEIVRAKERLILSKIDPMKKDTTAAPAGSSPLGGGGLSAPKGVSSLSAPIDSLSTNIQKDSLGVAIDTLSSKFTMLSTLDTLAKPIEPLTPLIDSIPQKDTTEITFLEAFRNVRVFRYDVQSLCDSLIYTSLDSIARMYKEPILWSNITNQLTSDSMQLVIRDNKMTKANMLSNAFIITEEDTTYYNQIKGVEMIGYFKDNDLVRFDALGGASAIFFLEEDSLITTMNQKESRMISATIKNKEIQRIHYIEGIKSDAFPVYNLAKENQRLKGFHWRGKERPINRFDITDRVVKNSVRHIFANIPRPQFYDTKLFFPNYIEDILQKIELSDLLRKEKRIRDKFVSDSLKNVKNNIKDSLVTDSTVTLDSTKLDKISKLDSIIIKSDSISNSISEIKKSIKELKLADIIDKKAIRKAKKSLRKAKRAFRKAKKAERKRAKKERNLKKREKTRIEIENKSK